MFKLNMMKKVQSQIPDKSKVGATMNLALKRQLIYHKSWLLIKYHLLDLRE